MHLLRLLRTLRLRGLCESEPANLRAAGAFAFAEFHRSIECEVARINLDGVGKRAVSGSYVDQAGEEWEQPADIVLVCAFTLFNVRLMLLSGIGKPYDPRSGAGVVGRNYAYQILSASTSFLKDKTLNPFIATGAFGMVIDDYNGDNFDHSATRLRRWRLISCATTNGRPIQYSSDPGGHAEMGQQMEEGGRRYLSTRNGAHRPWSCYSYRDSGSISTDLQGPARSRSPSHDLRLPRQRIEDVGIPDPAPGGDRARDGSGEDERRPASRALLGDEIPDDAQRRRHGDGTDPTTSAVNRYLPELGRA